VGSAEERSTFAAGNTARTQACGLRQSEALAIMRVKGFDFEGCAVRLREQSHTAVRHRAVHIRQQHVDLSGPLLECVRGLVTRAKNPPRGRQDGVYLKRAPLWSSFPRHNQRHVVCLLAAAELLHIAENPIQNFIG